MDKNSYEILVFSFMPVFINHICFAGRELSNAVNLLLVT